MTACTCACSCVPDEKADARAATWSSRRLSVTVRGETHLVRLVRFERGWLASTNAIDGPTLGHDASPYLAVRRALEPLGVGLAEAMVAVGGLDLGLQAAGPGTSLRNSGTASSEAARS